MKLYYAPGACSQNPHILLREAGLKFDLVKVDLREHKTEKGTDYYSVNPNGYVPALELDNGEVLTENPAIAQYIADQKPELKLAPANGTLERYRLQEWLGFIGTEIHKQYSPLFRPGMTDAEKKPYFDKLSKRFDYVVEKLKGKQFLLGDQFTAADSYLFVLLGWSKIVGFDLSKWPALQAYQERISSRPAVKATLEAEFGKA
ncbi:glutathione transferase GstA [Hyalangium versicolor]|uniref:glutathione transferase GstA n=1 Tax=Hyalangium versicolor TaxID=2861190 RepID=UPI001CC99052|nr:glutathione transferase GstA [Hyalangium versicolor]